MNSLALVHDFLGRHRLAVVGVSRNSADFTRSVFDEFVRRGYDAIPVNPAAAEIGGRPCFHRVTEIQPPVEGALLFTSPDQTDEVVRDCAQAGVNLVWMHRGAGRGAVSPRAVDFCREKGMQVVAGECPWMFLSGSDFPHNVHRLFRKIFRHYPQ